MYMISSSAFITPRSAPSMNTRSGWSRLSLCAASVPSLGDLVRQGKANLDSWWIIFPTFAVLVATLLLLTFVGDALRDAFDTRKS